MKTIGNIAIKVVSVLFVCTLLSDYLNEIKDYEPFVRLNYNSLITKITFVVCCIYLLCVAVKRQNKYLSASNIIVMIIIYSAYRFDIIVHNEWEFVHLVFPICYMDIIYLLPLSLFNYPIYTIGERDEAKHNLTDAINEESEDKFGYYGDAEQLVKFMLTQKSLYRNNSLIIGLRGEWGEGKTSYLNMLELYAQKHNKKEINIIRFNPWFSNSYEQMVQDFFAELAKKFDLYSIDKELSNYAKIISDADLGIWSKMAKFISKSKERTLADLHMQLNSYIKIQPKLNVILIDDLDRLNEHEILNVFKLIRNNVNFANTVFVVGYDYRYIKETLKNIDDFDRYIEKIFPCPYVLPERKYEDMFNVKKERMRSLLNLGDEYSIFIDEFLKNIGDELSLRNAQRIALQVSHNYTNLKDEDGNLLVNLLDYLTISYLSILAPDIYKNIAHTNSNFIKNDLLVNKYGYYMLNFDKGMYLSLNNEYIETEEYISKLRQNGLCEDKANVVFTILCGLFNRSDAKYPSINSKLYRISRISDARTFPMFFTRYKETDFVTNAEFNAAWTAGSDVFIERLVYWVQNKDKHSLSHQIANMRLSSNKDWIIAFDAVRNIYPLSSLERFKTTPNPSVLTYVVIPGEYAMGNIQRSSDEYREYIKILWENVVDTENDDIENIYKKYLILGSRFVTDTLRQIFYINSSIDSGTNGYNHWTKIPYINIEEVKIENIKRRLSRINSYDNFHSEYWYDCDDFETAVKLEIIELYKNHIVEHIDSFIDNFPDILNESFINRLFYLYTITDGRTIQEDEKNWIPNFVSFLKSIPYQDDKIIQYIENINQQYKI